MCVDERGQGLSRESFGDVTVPARPHSQPVTWGPRLFPQRLKSEMNLSEQFITRRPSQISGLEPYELLYPFY